MITKEQLYSIPKNDSFHAVRLTLYNGEKIDCFPIVYQEYKDVLTVSLPRSNDSFEIRREVIDSYIEIPLGGQNYTTPIDLITQTYTGEYAKKMIIVGAGASHGYSLSPINPKLPLANGIFSSDFDSILGGFQGAKNFATSSLYSLNDLESYFQKTWDRIKRYDVYDKATVSSLINMQYYLSALFLDLSDKHKGNRYNNYNHLVQMINTYLSDKPRNEKVIIVSFNYDTLLEEALTATLSQKFTNIGDYVDYRNRNILLFKPHGSCNWFRSSKLLRDMPASLIDSIKHSAKILFDKSTGLGELNDSLSPKIEIIDHSSYDEQTSDFYHYPQLLIPFKDKDDFSMPEVHTNILSHLLSKVDDILVIGWKGTEVKFQKLLKDQLSSKQVNIYYANHNDTSIETLYRNILPRATITNVKDKFQITDQHSRRDKNSPADFHNLIYTVNQEVDFFFGS